jgi:ubiquinone/menaquinone biosynthesis C-methylase UbiE/peptidoglycan/xylan/chitin deacetylase (PgdA/CDA1 family)
MAPRFAESLKRITKMLLGVAFVMSGFAWLWGLLGRCADRARKRVLILMFHNVGAPSTSTMNYRESDFRRVIEYLKRRYELASLPQAIDYLSGSGPSRPLAVLTFDDSYREIHEKVWPILEAEKVPAAVFVPTAWVGKDNGWVQRPVDRMILMDWAAIGRVARSSAGQVRFYSHSVTHAHLPRMRLEDLRKELVESRQVLEAHTGQTCDVFCYPWGQADNLTPEIFQALRAAGYRAAASTIWGRYSSPRQLYALRRIRIDYGDSLSFVKLKLWGGLDWLEPWHLMKGRGNRARVWRQLNATTGSDSKTAVRTHFDGLANRYAVSRHLDPGFRIQQDLVLALMHSTPSLTLEVGCGVGVLARTLMLRGHRVVGLDLSNAMLQHAAASCAGESSGRSVFAVGDAEQLPLGDHTVKQVLCMGVLEYLPAHDRALAEMARVLGPGGLLVLTVPTRYSLYRFLERIVESAAPVYRMVRDAVNGRRRPEGIYRSRNSCRPSVLVTGLREHGFDEVLTTYCKFVPMPLDRWFPNAAYRVDRLVQALGMASRFGWLGGQCVFRARRTCDDGRRSLLAVGK